MFISGQFYPDDLDKVCHKHRLHGLTHFKDRYLREEFIYVLLYIHDSKVF